MSIISNLWKKLTENERVSDGPNTNYFPDVGANGEITIDCIVTPAARPPSYYTSLDEQGDSRTVGVTPHCVGAFLVEVDEYGLRFRWQPAEKLDKKFLSPFSFPYGPDKIPDPTQDRSNNGNP